MLYALCHIDSEHFNIQNRYFYNIIIDIVIDIRYLSGVADDEAGGGHVPPVRDHNLDIDRYRYLQCLVSIYIAAHRAAPLPVVGDDLPVIIPEHEGGVQVEGARLGGVNCYYIYPYLLIYLGI